MFDSDEWFPGTTMETKPGKLCVVSEARREQVVRGERRGRMRQREACEFFIQRSQQVGTKESGWGFGNY